MGAKERCVELFTAMAESSRIFCLRSLDRANESKMFNKAYVNRGPLAGVRVVDLTTSLSGPLCTMMLADQGADVIKVEALDCGDESRQVGMRRDGLSAKFLNNNRNKRSVTLDLTSGEGLSVLLTLVEKADVFVHNFPPGVAERVGVGPAALRSMNTRLIYASITGFGFNGPLSKKPASDPLVQAVSGLTTVQSGRNHKRPHLVNTLLADKLTGYQTAQAITAALYARERTQEGQEVYISMLDTMVSFLWSSDMDGHTFIGDEVDEEFSLHDSIYQVEDGVITISIITDKHWHDFAGAFKRLDLLREPHLVTAELRDLNRDMHHQAVQEAVANLSVAEVVKALDGAGVPHAQNMTRTEMRQHPQLVSSGTIFEYDHPIAGRLRQARHAAVFSKTPTSVRHGAPMLGQHTREVLREFGVGEKLIVAVERAAKQRST